MLSLREFDSTNASLMVSIPAGQSCGVPEHAGSIFLEFAAQSSRSLPAFIASFANPVHVHSDDCSDTASELDMIGNGNLEAAAAQSWELDVVSRQSQAPGPSQLSPATTVV